MDWCPLTAGARSNADAPTLLKREIDLGVGTGVVIASNPTVPQPQRLQAGTGSESVQPVAADSKVTSRRGILTRPLPHFCGDVAAVSLWLLVKRGHGLGPIVLIIFMVDGSLVGSLNRTIMAHLDTESGRRPPHHRNAKPSRRTGSRRQPASSRRR